MGRIPGTTGRISSKMGMGQKVRWVKKPGKMGRNPSKMCRVPAKMCRYYTHVKMGRIPM